MTAESTQKALRQIKRKSRQALTPGEKASANQIISKKVIRHESYQVAKKIACYLCMPEEVNVKSIIEDAWERGKIVYLPVVIKWGKPLQFAPYHPDTALIKDPLDIDIPNVSKDEYVDATALDMVVTPLVAFDSQRNRIGMGGGFYDRTFAFKAQTPGSKPTLIGVAYEAQHASELIVANTWDIRPDQIISEKSIY